MASTKVAVLVAIICFLLQCVDSQSILSKQRVSDQPMGKHAWKLPVNDLRKEIQIPTPRLTDLEDIVSPDFKISSPKPTFGRKPGKFAKRKSAFLKERVANVRCMPTFSESKIGNGIESGKIRCKIGNVFRRRLLAAPKLALDKTSRKLNFSAGTLGSNGVTLNESLSIADVLTNTVRQRLADMLGLGNRFQFFDERRRGTLDRTNRIFDLKRLNPLDMFDGKLAKLNARFGKTIDRVHNRFDKKIDRLNFSLIETSLLKSRLDKALNQIYLNVPTVDGNLSDVDRALAGIKEKADIIDGKFQQHVLKSAGAKNRSLLGGLKLSRGFSRLGGGLTLRRGFGRRRGVNLGGGLRIGRSKFFLDPPKFSLRSFRRNGGHPPVQVDSRTVEAIANIIIAGINGVAPALYSNGNGGGPRRLRERQPRFSFKRFRKPRLNLDDKIARRRFKRKFGERLKFRTLKSGRLSAILANKFEKASAFYRKFGGKFIATSSDYQLTNIKPIVPKFDEKSKTEVFDFVSPTSTEAPAAVSATNVAPTTATSSSASSTASAISENTSKILSARLGGPLPIPEVDSQSLSMRKSPTLDALGTDGVLFAIGLLESGATVEDATEALLQRNNMPALKTLLSAVHQASIVRR